MPLRTLIVDDNASFRTAARTILDGPEFRVVGEAASAGEALRRAEELDPEIILLDIDLGEDSGFAVARRLSARIDGAGAKLIMISIHPEERFADLIAESPAVGFLAKSDLAPYRLAELLRDR